MRPAGRGVDIEINTTCVTSWDQICPLVIRVSVVMYCIKLYLHRLYPNYPKPTYSEINNQKPEVASASLDRNIHNNRSSGEDWALVERNSV